MFDLAPLKIGVVIAVVLALTGGTTYILHSIRRQAIEQEQRRVQEANDEARRKALEGQTDVDACVAAGGVWLRERGVCRPPVRGSH